MPASQVHFSFLIFLFEMKLLSLMHIVFDHIKKFYDVRTYEVVMISVSYQRTGVSVG